MCILPVLGPRYLTSKQNKARYAGSMASYWGLIYVSKCGLSHPSLYLKCLKARFMTSWMSPSKRGWRGIWKKTENVVIVNSALLKAASR